MVKSPKKGKPVEDDDYSDTDRLEEEEEWIRKMIAYVKKRVLEFFSRKTLLKRMAIS